MKILFFDTETTDLYDFKAPPTAEHQPHMLQLGAILCDGETGEEFCVVDLLSTVQVDVPLEAYGVHGITREMTEAFGVSQEIACSIFLSLAAKADLWVGHNIEYDLAILSAAVSRIGKIEWLQGFAAKQRICTMKLSTDICCIKGPRGNKWPKLVEAYRFFFNEEFEKAHSAMGDVRACKRIFFKLKELGHVTI